MSMGNLGSRGIFAVPLSDIMSKEGHDVSLSSSAGHEEPWAALQVSDSTLSGLVCCLPSDHIMFDSVSGSTLDRKGNTSLRRHSAMRRQMYWRTRIQSSSA
jgi:hypothetical protein